MIKNRQFPALRDSEAERRRSDHARRPPLLREGDLRRVERIRQRHLQLFRCRERQRLPRCHPQAQQRLRHRLLQSSSLLPHWAMPSFIFFLSLSSLSIFCTKGGARGSRRGSLECWRYGSTHDSPPQRYSSRHHGPHGRNQTTVPVGRSVRTTDSHHTSRYTTPRRCRSCRRRQARWLASWLQDASRFRYCHRTTPPSRCCCLRHTCSLGSYALPVQHIPTPPPWAGGTAFPSIGSTFE